MLFKFQRFESLKSPEWPDPIGVDVLWKPKMPMSIYLLGYANLAP